MKNMSICVRDLTAECDKWIALPMNIEEELQQSHEYIIVDCEGIQAREYDCIGELNALAETIAEMDEDEATVLMCILENHTSDFEEALEIVESGNYTIYSDCRDMSDVAYHYMEETGMLDEMLELAQRYFDFEMMGRDMEIESTFLYCDELNGYINIF
jgi:antirestriction protein